MFGIAELVLSEKSCTRCQVLGICRGEDGAAVGAALDTAVGFLSLVPIFGESAGRISRQNELEKKASIVLNLKRCSRIKCFLND